MLLFFCFAAMRRLLVQVIPQAKQEGIQKVQTLLGEEIWKVRLRAKPVDGEANKALIVVLAKHFAVPKRCIRIEK